MAETKKTDNHYTGDKVALRVIHSPWKEGETLRVLDAFGGKGIVWKAVERKTGLKISRAAIDQRSDISTFHLHGENTKVMAGLDLNTFDVIDLDAYGVPVAQLQQIFSARFKGVVFVTAIQTLQGGLPKRMLMDIGFPESVTKKCPTLPARHGWVLLKEWLALNGVKKVHHRSLNRKHYFTFSGAEVYATD